MKTIVWDVDDVLNDLMRFWFETAWRPAHPDCRVGYHGLSQNPPHHLLGVDLHGYLASLDAFRLSGAFQAMPPVIEVLRWFEDFGPRYRHVALTAAPLRSVSISAEWVLRHFGRWIRAFGFVPSRRPGESLPLYDRDKADYLRWLNAADILIDDNPIHVEAARAMGLEAILIARPWSRHGVSLTEALQCLTEQALAQPAGLPPVLGGPAGRQPNCPGLHLQPPDVNGQLTKE
jgi:hypothetical protein